MLLAREMDFGLRARLPPDVAAVPLPAVSRRSPMTGAAVMRSTKPTILDLDMHRLDDVLRRAEGRFPKRTTRSSRRSSSPTPTSPTW